MITYLIPARNEARWIGGVIEEIHRVERPLVRSYEILVVDNASTDATGEVARSLGARVVICPQIGYGRAIEYGVERAFGDLIAVLDADGTYCPRDVQRLESLLVQTPSAFAIGSRVRGVIEEGAMPALHRWLGTPVLTFLIRLLCPDIGAISDCNCGLRMAQRQVWRKLQKGPPGMSWASWSLMQLGALKIKVVETPIGYRSAPAERASHLRTWRDGFRHLMVILAEGAALRRRPSR